MKAKRIFLAVSLAAATVAGAKEPPKPPIERRSPPLPLLAPLDKDEDGSLSAEEIANASAVLGDLDKNGDGELTKKEILPPPPKKGDDGSEEGDAVPPPPGGRKGGKGGGEKGGGKGGEKGLGPIVGALDADKDGVISADEIEDASQSLLTLDKDSDGVISPKELKPKKPPGKGGK